MPDVALDPSPAEARYHHGSLRQTLVEVGLELARQGGPEAVVVREASRRAGVSHNAAYRHFPDRSGFLDAVSARCMDILARRMEARMEAVTLEEGRGDDLPRLESLRFHATGEAYFAFALEEPGWYRTAYTCRQGAAGPAGAGGDHGDGPGPFEILSARLDALMETGGLRPGAREGADVAVWSAVHGLAMLILEGPLGSLPETQRQDAIDSVLGLLGGALLTWK
ncbi:MAG: TetR/AcrR family transcriptional regulator [Acidimicrobiales bacterium]